MFGLQYTTSAVVCHPFFSAAAGRVKARPDTQSSFPRKEEGAGNAGNAGCYLTEPVIPSANCFCRTKKTMIVGREQKRTPSISMP